MNAITADPANNRMLVRASGFWTPDAIVRFCDAFRAALPALGKGVGSHAIVCELIDGHVSPAATVEAFKAILSSPAMESIRSRHFAFVTGSALARMQFQRLAVRPGIRVFERAEDAHAWIAAERAAVAC